MIGPGFALARRPPLDVSSLVVASSRSILVGVGRGCGCGSDELAAVVMTELGMRHAAAMHADPDRDWTREDWFAHIGEEHEILFPALLAAGAGDPTTAKIVARLEVDHAVYLERLSSRRRYFEFPRGSEPYSVDVHAGIEDGLVRQYASALRAARSSGVGVGESVGEMIMVSKDFTASVAPAKTTHAPSSWWPWAIGSAVGLGAWAVGFGPLGIALSVAGSAGGSYAVQKKIADKPKPPSLLYMPSPKTFGDPEAYFKAVAKEAADVHAAIAARKDESDERVKDWKKAAKNIPIIGDFAGLMLDFGAWLGGVLGSAYAEQNSPESLQDAADAIARWFQWGHVPPPPRFTVKDGAKFYAAELNAGLELLHEGADKSLDDKLTAQALKAMGNLTMLHAGCPAMDRGIADAATGSGSLHTAPSTWHAGEKLGGFESIVAGIVSCEFAVPYEAAFAYARKAVDHDYPIKPGLTTHRLANAFTETMRAASLGNIPPVTP